MSLKCPTDLQCLSSSRLATNWSLPLTMTCTSLSKKTKQKKTFWDSANAAVSSMKPIAISEIRREVVSGVTKDASFSSPWCDVYLQFSELAPSATCASNNLLMVFLFVCSVRMCLLEWWIYSYTFWDLNKKVYKKYKNLIAIATLTSI